MKENEAYVHSHISSLLGEKLHTLDRGKPFTVDYLHRSLIIITTSTGAPRNVPYLGTIDAYNHIKKHGKLTRTEIAEQNYTIQNTAYIAAILASFPEIDYTTGPITLFLKPKD